ncbi:unnamed protein product [Didymodactylos carnosus]|uniref:Uncharacterized protein n=1 Tax=Didymodactylos carnosus TaxID=1234261 RepID=A0A814VSD3_9BILA|nr:unnamed protein product [Didymodactylos carnosus]CAF3955523.1 unnamed protein product [Didymodactylos carnosus]
MPGISCQCASAHEYCAVCSAERSLDSPHMCTNVTKCRNCCGDHSYTYSQCPALLQYRRELIKQLLEKDTVPDHVHIPKAFRSRPNSVFPLTPAQNRVTSHVKQQVNRTVSPVSEINKAHVHTMLNLSNQINMLGAKVDRVSSKVEQMKRLVSKVVIPCVFTLADSLVKLDEKISCMEDNCSTRDATIFWKYTAKHFTTYAPQIKALTHENDLISDPQQILDRFAEHYKNHFRLPVEEILRETKEEVQQELEFSTDPGDPFVVTYHEIENELNHLKSKRVLDP